MTFLRIAGWVETNTGGEMTMDPAELYEEWRQLLREKLGVRVDGPLLTRPISRNPPHSTYNIIAYKFKIIHLSYACYKWSKSSYYWNKSCNNDGLASMFFIKSLCLFQIFFFEKS